jgi:hypothetical protein
MTDTTTKPEQAADPQGRNEALVMHLFAIGDTDGGRNERAIPLFKHIYPTRAAAEAGQNWFGYDPKYYPVIEIELRA